MATSTGQRGYSLIAALLVVCWLVPARVLGDQPVIGVAPLDYAVPTVGQGLAELLALHIADCGPWRAKCVDRPPAEAEGEQWSTSFTEHCDYVLLGRVVAFCVADRDQGFDLGDDLADLARQVGMGGSTAQVSLELELWSVADRSRITAWQVDALESRKGTRLDPLTTGGMASIDYLSDDFRQTMVGRAAHKAIGEVLYGLLEILPLTGQVLAISGDAVIVDLGTSAGVVIGDELIVFEPMPILATDGAVAWDADMRIAAIRVLETMPDRALCLLMDAESAVAEGMRVRPLTAKYALPVEADSL